MNELDLTNRIHEIPRNQFNCLATREIYVGFGSVGIVEKACDPLQGWTPKPSQSGLLGLQNLGADRVFMASGGGS